MKIAERVRSLPPYLFAAIEREIAKRKAAGIDIISLGIGDPDLPTPPHVVEALAAAAADSSTHQYPSNRGELGFREAVAGFYEGRFGVTLDPAEQIVPCWAPRRASRTSVQVLLDPGDVALGLRPGVSRVRDGSDAGGRHRRVAPASAGSRLPAGPRGDRRGNAR